MTCCTYTALTSLLSVLFLPSLSLFLSVPVSPCMCSSCMSMEALWRPDYPRVFSRHLHKLPGTPELRRAQERQREEDVSSSPWVSLSPPICTLASSSVSKLLIGGVEKGGEEALLFLSLAVSVSASSFFRSLYFCTRGERRPCTPLRLGAPSATCRLSWISSLPRLHPLFLSFFSAATRAPSSSSFWPQQWASEVCFFSRDTSCGDEERTAMPADTKITNSEEE